MPIIFNKYYPLRKIIFFLGEGLLIFLSLLFVDYLLMGKGLFLLDYNMNMVRALSVTIVFQLCLYFFDQYDLSNETSIPNTITRITQAFGVGCILLGLLYYTVPSLIILTRVFWVGYLFICIFVLTWRGIYHFVLRKRLFVQNILVVGNGKMATSIAQETEGVQDSVYKIVGFVGEKQPGYNPHKAPVFENLTQFNKLLESNNVERIIVALDDARGNTPLQELLRWKLRGVLIDQGTTFYERITGKILVEKLPPSWIVYSDGFYFSRWRVQVKRLMDLVFSAILLLLTLPIAFVTAILIKIDSQGPVFYSQERVGFRGLPFKLLKFRSMCVDAERNGAVWAQKNDARVTRIGSVIRRLRVDEIPQLWNVLKGDMSLVGPRPERQVFVEKLQETIPYYNIRHVLKPGLTGWAQVCYPYGASEYDAVRKLEYDLYYMKNLSIILDLIIIFKTVKTVLFQKGAR
jgi:sugar transferase (PEP-CTERM system associated)